MQQIKLNETTAARRRIPVALVDDTDGKSPKTEVTLSAGDLKISKNGGAEANHEGTLVELAGGDYYYEAAASECNTLGYLTGRIVKAGIRTFRFAVQIVAFDPYAVPPTVEEMAQAVAQDTAIAQGLNDAALAKTAATAAQAAAENLQTRVPAALSSDGNMLADVQSVKNQPLNATKPFDVL